jgi:hypothetical protein
VRQKPELLLFDLGGVLVEFTGFRDLRLLLREPLPESAIKQKWLACPAIRELEIGNRGSLPNSSWRNGTLPRRPRNF